jgi:hypothetical protein
MNYVNGSRNSIHHQASHFGKEEPLSLRLDHTFVRIVTITEPNSAARVITPITAVEFDLFFFIAPRLFWWR